MGKRDSKKIEIITGNSDKLDISQVKKHLDIQKPKQKTSKKDIIIPSENKKNIQ